jgi:RNA polymerase sigma-70 factor (ECF subfamily)
MDDDALASLMRAALAGDEDAYRTFLGAVSRAIRPVVRARLRGMGGCEVEDVVQDTLLAIHAKRHTWRSNGPIMPWIHGIARHKTVDAVRRRAGIHLDIADFEEVLADPPAEPAPVGDLARALAALPARLRTVLTAVAVDGRTIRDTAAINGISEGAVRVALHRGLKAIRTGAGGEP